MTFSSPRSMHVEKKLTLVLGMHRSGTSAAARLLNLLGGDLGRNLLPPKPDNPQGFWENARIVQAHDDFLWDINRVWNNPVARRHGMFDGKAADRLVDKLVEILRDDFSGDEIVVKDPRLCRLLPAWRRVADQLGWPFQILLVSRDPRAVCASLQARDGMDRDAAGLLWARYSLEMEADSRGLPRAFVDYEGLLNDWRQEWNRVSVDLEFRPVTSEVAAAVDQFVNRGMQHHRGDAMAVPDSALWQRVLMPLYEAMAGTSGPGDSPAFDTLAERLNEIDEPYRQVLFDWDAQLLDQRARLDALTAEAYANRRVRADFERTRDALAVEISEKQKLMQELEAVYASTSWRASAPLRWVRNMPRTLRARLGSPTLRRVLRDLYYALPLPRRAKHWIRRHLAPLLRGEALQRHGSGPYSERYRRSHLFPPLSADAVCEYLPGDDARSRPALPCSDTPCVSVVIPVYNKAEYTAACLLSIAANPPQVPFETIIVDDGSTDCTEEFFSSWPGVRYFRNQENLGFIGACNRGAAEARGRFVCFLNNDTNVLEGWLDELVSTAQSDTSIGLAGSKLVYPNGILQEAGGIVWRDGSAWNYGRMQDPDAPSFSYRRDVDYVSGASILVPTELFRELGGFDDHYKPAYYEDTDLALKIRDRGLRVVLQPESIVIHYEGISSGTDTGSGIKKYQAINEEKFRDRWRQVLAAHRLNGDDPEREKERAVQRRLLMIDATLPFPDQDAGSVIADHFIRIFQQMGYKVTFVPDNLEYSPKYTRRLQARGVECIYHPHVVDVQDFIRERAGEFDLVFVARPYVADGLMRPIKEANPSAPIIYNTCDLHFLREQRQAEVENNAYLRARADKTREQELRVIGAADCTIVVSPVEKEILAKELPQARVEVIQLIQEEQSQGLPAEERRGMVFIGGFQHHPNGDAVRWFVSKVVPALRAAGIDETLYVVGSRPTPDVLELAGPGIEILGFVEDIAPIFEQVRCMVVPLRFGAGVKGKIGTAFAFGLPVISSDVGVEGMDLEPGLDFLSANTPQEWVEAITRIEDDGLWQALSDAGRVVVRERFTPSVVHRQLEAVLARLERQKGCDA